MDKKQNEIKGYHGFSITGRCGPIDWSKSEIVERQFGSNCPVVKMHKGIYVGLDEWDGKDFFLPGTVLNVATKLAADVLKKTSLQTLDLEI